MDVIYAVWILPFLVALLFLYHRIQKREDALAIYESSTRLLVIQSLGALWLLGTFATGILSLTGIILIHLNDTAVSIPIFVVFLLLSMLMVYPAVHAVFTYRGLDRAYRHAYQLREDEPPMQEHTSLLQESADELNLKSLPHLVYSNLNDISPFIFGKRLGNARFVLPANFNRLVDHAADNDPHLAVKIKRFVFLHELAHLKNGDGPLLSWAFSLLHSLKYWPLAAIVTAAVTVALANPLKGWVVNLTLGTLGLYLFLIFDLMLLQRHREHLADGRASLRMRQKDLDPLLAESSKKWAQGLSVLEVFLSLLEPGPFEAGRDQKLTSAPAKPRPLAEPQLRHWINRLWHAFYARHPSTESRINALEEGKHLAGQRIYPSISTSILAGVAYTVWHMALFPVAIYSVVALGLAFRVNWGEGPLHFFVSFFIVGGALVLPSLIFTIPIAHSTVTKLSLRKLTTILTRLVVFAVTIAGCRVLLVGINAVVTNLGIESAFGAIPDAPVLMALGVFPVGLALFLTVAASTTQRDLQWDLRYKEISIREALLVIVVMIAAVITAIGPQLYDIIQSGKLEMFIPLVSGLLAFTLLYTYHLRSENKPFDIELAPRLVFLRGGQRSVYIPLYTHATYILAYASLPLLIGLGPILLLMNAFDRALPSLEGFGIPLLTAELIVMTSLAFIGASPKIRSRSPWEIRAVLHMFQNLCAERLEDSEGFAHTLLEKRYENGGFLHTMVAQRKHREWLGDMGDTFAYMSALNALDTDHDKLQATTDWVWQCQRSNGGFSRQPHPQVRPTLQSTYYALAILEMSGQVDNVEPETHVAWIKRQRIPDAGFKSAYYSDSQLSDTYFAVKSLKMLGKPYEDPSLMSWLCMNWEASRKDIRATYLTVASLATCNDLQDRNTLTKFKRVHETYESDIVQTLIDRKWEEIYLFHELTKLLNREVSQELKEKLTLYLKDSVARIKTQCRIE